MEHDVDQHESGEQAADVSAAEHGAAPLDLDRIEGDLADVEAALARLEAGTYWIDEVTGEPLDDDLLTRQPTARTAG